VAGGDLDGGADVGFIKGNYQGQRGNLVDAGVSGVKAQSDKVKRDFTPDALAEISFEICDRCLFCHLW
jgi:hypothetical protein